MATYTETDDASRREGVAARGLGAAPRSSAGAGGVFQGGRRPQAVRMTGKVV